jgi:hypothetical protein
VETTKKNRWLMDNGGNRYINEEWKEEKRRET